MSTTDIQPPAWDRASWNRQSDDRQYGDRNWDRHGDRQADRHGDWSHHRHHDHGHHRQSWLSRAEGWLDDKGKGAWIAAMILGFILFWPIGLGLLAYMIWSKRMFSKSCNRSHRSHAFHAARAALRPSGNTAFDSYKTETLRRLEDEQRAFEDFLGRLRAAKDKAEFDQFMDDRASRPQGRPSGDDAAPEPAGT